MFAASEAMRSMLPSLKSSRAIKPKAACAVYRLVRGLTFAVLFRTIMLLFTPHQARAEDSPNAQAVPESISSKLQVLFLKYYPEVTFTNHALNGLRFEYRVKTYEFPYNGPPGKKHQATTERGPMKGGILCTVSLLKGEYAGQLLLHPRGGKQHDPYLTDKKVYKILFMVPYSARRDSILWTVLSFPSDASQHFLKEFRAVIRTFATNAD